MQFSTIVSRSQIDRKWLFFFKWENNDNVRSKSFFSSPGRIDRVRRFSAESGAKPDQITMVAIRNEINKTLHSLSRLSFCSRREKNMRARTAGNARTQRITRVKRTRWSPGKKRITWYQRRTRIVRKAGKSRTTGSKGRARVKRSPGSQGATRCQRRTRRIHFIPRGWGVTEQANG